MKKTKQNPINKSISDAAKLIEQAESLLCDIHLECQYSHPVAYALLSESTLDSLRELAQVLDDVSKIKAKF